MFLGLPNPILKLVFQNSRKGAPRGGRGILKVFYKKKNPILMKLGGIQIFFRATNSELKLVFQNSKRGPPGGGGGRGKSQFF